MSDAVKWGLLVAGLTVIIGLVVMLPFVQYINFGELQAALVNVVDICSDVFEFARGLVNLFFLPFGRKVITGLMIWLIAKWAIKGTINITAWVYHFIFK